MNELAQHIEKLLQESDFAIIPGFGGFIAHYTPAVREAKSNLFMPPTRTIGFNAKLTLNDGLLAQSYMLAHDVSLKEAYSLISLTIREMHTQLEENGKLVLEGVGTLWCDANNQYSFKPTSKSFDSPLLYGFLPFEIEEIDSKGVYRKTSYSTQDSRSSRFQANYLGSIALVAVAVASLLMFSTPVENTEVITSTNQANLIAGKLWSEDNKAPLTTTPLVVYTDQESTLNEEHPLESGSRTLTYSHITPSTNEVLAETIIDEENTEVIQTTEITEDLTVATKETQEVSTISSPTFHIIVASAIRSDYAEDLVNQLKAEGFANAQILNKDNKTRVSASFYESKEKAYKELNKLINNSIYNTAWVLKAD